MALVTPCTDWYLIFTGMGKGDVPLCSSILPFNLILQLLLLPFYIFLFFGRSVPYDPFFILGIVAALFLILALAQIVRHLMERRRGETWIKNNFEQKSQTVPTMLLGLAIVFMFASWSSSILGNPLAVLQLLIPLLIFYFTIYPFGRILGRLFGFSRAGSVCIASTLTARNSPTVLPIAVLAFPEMPLVAITQIIITLVEIPVMLVLTSLSLKVDLKHTDND
jgi:ACR3 family arsenite efflux pump ArsB